MSEKLPDIWQGPAEAIGELLLDRKLETTAPALAQIPLLSLVIAAYKSKGAISDYLLARKVQQFYSSWEHLDDRTRKKIYQKFQKKPRAFAEKLLLLLVQQEDMEKCRLLGAITAAYLEGDLKRAEYLDMIETVAHMSLRDLLQLVKVADLGPIVPRFVVGERFAMMYLTRGILTTETQLPEEQRDDDETYYRLTTQGEQLAGHIGRCELKEAL